MSTEEKYYETKCRRCGHITAWALPGAFEEITEKRFKELMINFKIEKMNHPSTYPCAKCNKETVQDTVSFNYKFDFLT